MTGIASNNRSVIERRKALIGIASFAGVASCPVTALTVSEWRVDHQAAVQRVATAYRSCKSYRDSIEVESHMIGRNYKGVVRSLYSAPDRMIVQARYSTGSVAAFMAVGSEFKQWTGNGGWRTLASLDQLFAGLLGATVWLGNAGYLTACLLPLAQDVTDSGWLGRITPNVSADRDASAIQLQGDFKNARLALTIDPRTFLIQSCQSESRIGRSLAKHAPRVNELEDFNAAIIEFRKHPADSVL